MAELNVLNTKTVRFGKVVEAAGKPEPYTLWKDPARDSDFQKALREQRLMTVLRQRSKPDIAIVGYLKKTNASYLLFPKSIGQFTNRRIVGLKYDLLTEPKAKGKPVRIGQGRPAPAKSKRVKAVAAEPKQTREAAVEEAETLPTFRVQAQIIVTFDREIEVQAKNQRQAREIGLKALKGESLDITKGSTQFKIKIKKATKLQQYSE